MAGDRFYQRNDLTNNFRANMAFALPLLGLYAYLCLAGHVTYRWRDLAAMGTSYFLFSYWFSPDLDVSVNRPGKGSFPLKGVIRGIKKVQRRAGHLRFIPAALINVLEPIHYALNFIWQCYWQPFANLFTHRGAVHIPLYGTQLKIIYVFTTYYLALLALTSIPGYAMIGGEPLRSYPRELYSLYAHILADRTLLLAWVAAMVADTCHIAIDWYDTKASFIPPPDIAPRGLIWRLSRYVGSVSKGGRGG